MRTPHTEKGLARSWPRAVTKNTVWLPLTLMGLYALLVPAVARVAPLLGIGGSAPAWAMPWTQTVVALLAVVVGLGAYGNAKREQQPLWKGAGLGVVHGLAHLALTGLAWALPVLLDVRNGPAAFGLRALGAVVLGLAGTVVVALYYRLADLADMQHNDAFAGLQIVDHKGHLRLTAHPDRLDVELRGIRRVEPGRTAQQYVSAFERLDEFSVQRGRRRRSGTATDV